MGAQAWSCGACEACAGEENATKVGGVKAAEAGGWEGEVGFGGKGGLSGGNEQYCREVVETYVLFVILSFGWLSLTYTSQL